MIAVRGAMLAVAATLAGCATAAKATLEDRFQAIGIPPATAGCMVDELDDRLSDEDLQDLARFAVSVSRTDSTTEAIRALRRIENPRAVSALGAAGLVCVTGLGS